MTQGRGFQFWILDCGLRIGGGEGQRVSILDFRFRIADWEGEGQRAENRRQRTENRGQKTEDKGQMTEGRKMLLLFVIGYSFLQTEQRA